MKLVMCLNIRGYNYLYMRQKKHIEKFTCINDQQKFVKKSFMHKAFRFLFFFLRRLKSLVSYIILYLFQCYSPKSSHPLPLPQRDGMGREEGGGFRMWNTCIPVADSF